MCSNVLMIHPADVAGNVPAGAVGIKWGDTAAGSSAPAPNPAVGSSFTP
jgi:hypothetical protein